MAKVKLKPVLGLRSPAAIAHDGKCNEVLIDPAIWWAFSPEERQFIIEHELAHCNHNVYDELSADRIGFEEYIEDGGNPYAAITALKRLGNSPAINERIETLSEALIQENMWHTRQPYIEYYEPESYSFLTGANGLPCEHPDNAYDPACGDAWGPDIGGSGGSSGGGRGLDSLLDIAERLGGLATEIIWAAKGRSGYPAGYPPPQQPRDNTMLYVIGALVVILLIFVLIKK